ncbi:MAG: hypothetical protein C5B51_15540 [Terriglobia bacterium]|nr:MAG: hypothetical protein C5B51_15540 [Terriglobia bacterium]
MSTRPRPVTGRIHSASNKRVSEPHASTSGSWPLSASCPTHIIGWPAQPCAAALREPVSPRSMTRNGHCPPIGPLSYFPPILEIRARAWGEYCPGGRTGMHTTIKIAFAVCLCSAAAWGQTSTAQINGTVRDASGLAVPSAEVKVTQTATGAVRTATSGPDGSYVLTSLPIGPYVLEVQKEGFSKYVQSGIVLQVDSNPTIDPALKVGTVNEQVMVQADAALVETRSTGVGQVVDNQRVVEMPLNGRNPIELVFLAGMASTAGGAGALNSVRNYPTVMVSVAGGQGNGMTYLLDGANFQDPYNSGSLPLPFPDALQEFKVETSALPAQYGFHAGAAVNAVTKSGTNAFHGDLFEFLRNGDLNARDFFAATRDTLKRNQYGGTIGGPIRKDKLFFFGGYQRTSLRSDPSQLTATIPTPSMLTGNFTAITSPACNSGRQINLPGSLGFTNNQVSPTLLNPVTVNITKTLPVTPDPCGRTSYGLVGNQDEDLYVARIDYQQSPKNSIFGRYTAANLNVGSTFDGKNPLSINTFGVHDLDYSLALGDTYLLTPNVVSSLRVAANRTNIVKISDHFHSLRDFGSNMTPEDGPNVYMTITGAFGIGTSASVPGESHNGPNPSVAEDISWVKGSHQVGLGGSWYRQMMNYWSGLNGIGNATYSGQITGLALADFMLGQAVSFNQGNIYGFYNRQNYIALYAQDNWRLGPRVTLNYGLRWEPYTAPYSKYGQFSHFDAGLFAQNFHSSVFTNAPAGLAFPGEPQYACGNGLNCAKWTNFFPRVGIVWDPKGDGRMTIRAAYGMFGDRNHMFYSNFMSQYAPFGNNISLSNVNIANPWATYPGGDPIPLIAATTGIGHVSHSTTFPLFSTYVIHRLQGYRPPYLNQWNISFQKQIGQDWLFTANYIGNSSIHLTTSNLANPAVFLGLGPCAINNVSYSTCSTTGNQNQRRPLYLQNPSQGQYYAGIAYGDDGGTGTYDALFLSVQKRLSRGVNLLANYTWSHCISDVFDPQTSAAAVASIPGNREAYRSNCAGSDLRQLFNLNMVARTPKFSGRALRLLASDWEIAPILQIKSAQFFTVTNGTDRALTTAAGQTPNLVNTNPYPANHSVNNWISLSAFSLPAPGTYGNLGQYNLKGPKIFQLNLGLSRTFPIHERKTIQLRGEAFNLPNHLNPNTPTGCPVSTGSLAAANFGQITCDISGNNGLTPGDYRVVQLALKFVF